MVSNRNAILLSSFTGLLLGLAFPPVPIGATIFVAFVPFFLLHSTIENYWQALHYSYITFFIFNLITLYWPAGFFYGRDLYMLIGGLLLIVVHPIFFLFPVTIWVFIRKRLGFKISLIAFPFIWTTFEYLHSLTQIAFPWLLLGNTQTYDLKTIQIAELTGVYGISFWIIIINVMIFTIFVKLLLKEWKILSGETGTFILLIIILYLSPGYYGASILKNNNKGKNKIVNIAIIQPNIDTFEKWTGNPEKPLDVVLQLTEKIDKDKTDLVIWPETTTPFFILHPAEIKSFERIKNQIDTLKINLLSGIPDIRYYREGEKIPKSSKKLEVGLAYDTYNSIVLLNLDNAIIQKYAKIKLVPFAERVPFSEELSFLNAMEWNFGLGGWGIGKDTTVFEIKTRQDESVKFSGVVCYESIYPSFIASFVKKGAEFLCVVTNDSWWGNTSGAYQHKQYAVLRAVENRRWVIQCANGGISCFIDPYGNIVQQTSMYVQTILSQEIKTNNEITPYTKYGDFICEYSLIVTLLFCSASIGSIFYKRIRKLQEEDISS